MVLLLFDTLRHKTPNLKLLPSFQKAHTKSSTDASTGLILQCHKKD